MNVHIKTARSFICTLILLTFLAGKSVTISAVHVIPFVMMVFEEAKSMNTVFIAIVVWLALRPVLKFKCAPIAPHELPF